MTTTQLHNAVFVRVWNQHYHQLCLIDNIAPEEIPYSEGGLILLNMDDRANIAQCLAIKCEFCHESIALFPDRKEIELKKWPDATMPTIDKAHRFADYVVGKTAIDDDLQNYTILHSWVIPPSSPEMADGQIMALCEMDQDDDSPEEEPAPLATSLAREQFTDSPWKFQALGSHAWEIFAPARQNETVAIVISNEADARLIAEAPNMFPLLKEYLRQHTQWAKAEPGPGQECQCHECIAARTIVARVLGEQQ